jgi:hypothetical protein
VGAWFVFPADTAAVFNSDPGSLWLQMIQRTELRLAKTETFAASLPASRVVLIDSWVIYQTDISRNPSIRKNPRQAGSRLILDLPGVGGESATSRAQSQFQRSSRGLELKIYWPVLRPDVLI